MGRLVEVVEAALAVAFVAGALSLPTYELIHLSIQNRLPQAVPGNYFLKEIPVLPMNRLAY